MSNPEFLSGLMLQNVCLELSSHTVLLKLDQLHIAPGDVHAIMGASGSGKTSLLQYICGVLPRSFVCQGKVFLDGRSIEGLPTEKRKVGIIFQSPLLFEHLSIAENIGFALSSCLTKKERQQKLVNALQSAGLEDVANHPASHTSGGQQARASLMRTLLCEPQALLLDEPFASLDSNRRNQFAGFLLQHIQTRQIPALLVTHDQNDCQRLHAKTWNLTNRSLVPSSPHS